MKDAFYAVLDRLVADAKRYRTAGFGTVDPEEATKHNLIEPLLESLGYGRDNIKKEFHILGDQVDYLLEQHTKPLLFMEAKSLLDSSPNLFNTHKQQVFRYIRNYRVSPEQTRMERPVTWIVLTNFREFHFIRVNEETPSFSFKVDELIARRDELWELLALENVEAHRIEELYDQTHKADLDKRFLADLKRWRLIIANGFALQNPGVSLPDLTKASQQLLDRFLFCRMLETDRLIEYNKLARQFMHYEAFYGERPTKPFCEALKESLFAEIKRDFNTELFLRPQLCDQLAIDNAYLSIVIGHEPMSPEVAAQCGLDQGQGELFPFKHLYGYDFSRMSGDIMGAVYERFLAHKLSAADRRVTIEETDELRKKEGIYYTPRYIVDYIIAHTVSEKIKPILGEAKALLAYMNFKGAHAKIRELQHIKVLDAAMGSGSFLLRAFDTFVAAYAGYNAECDRITRERGQNSGMLFDAPADLPEAVDHIGMHVASENIFGVDLDDSAVEVAKLNIWMRLMIAEKDFIRETLRTRRNGAKALSLLPTLANNLKRGNSLIDDPAVAGDAVFNWQQQFPDIMARGGFDCVIGNPPYERIQTMMDSAPKIVEFLKDKYTSAAAGNFDIYVCFIEHSIAQLLSPSGNFGYIVPHKFFQAEYGAALRKLLSDGRHVRKIVSFGDLQVFPQVSTYTCLLFLGKSPTEQVDYALVGDLDAFAKNGELVQRFDAKAEMLSVKPWNFVSEGSQSWMKKVEQVSKPLSEVTKQIFVGLQTSADTVFLFEAVEPAQGVSEVFSESLNKLVRIETKLLKPVIRSGEIGRYWAEATHLVLFPYRVGRGKTELLTEAEMQSKFPLAWDYLKKNEQTLRAREHGKFSEKGWWQLYPKNLDFWETPKVMAPYMIQRLAAFFDDENNYFVNVTTGGFGIRCSSEFQNKLLTGLLNGHLLDAYLKQISTNFRGGYFAANKQFLDRLPIKLPDPKSKKEKALADDIVKRVETIQAAQRRRQQVPAVLASEVAHRQREACPLGFYLQPDYTTAVRGETLIDDVQREGFVHGIRVESDRNTIAIAADVSDAADSASRPMPIVRLTFADETLQQFIYAMWQRFLEENARKKKWTAGKKPKPVYDLIVHELTPLVFFQQAPGDNLREIRAVAKAVADEAGTFDLAALETEITATDGEIDDLVYKLYGLTAEERQMVETASRR